MFASLIFSIEFGCGYCLSCVRLFFLMSRWVRVLFDAVLGMYFVWFVVCRLDCGGFKVLCRRDYPMVSSECGFCWSVLRVDHVPSIAGWAHL